MSYSNLLYQANQFEKLAGLLQVPPNALKDVQDFAVGKYCFYMAEKYKNVLQNYKKLNQNQLKKVNKTQLDEVKICYGYCKRLSHNISVEDKDSKRIGIKGSDIPYLPKQLADKIFFVIATFVGDNKSSSQWNTEGNWTGRWREWQGVINDKTQFLIGRILIKKDIVNAFNSEYRIDTVEKLQYEIQDIKETARHELQHFMQSFMRREMGHLGGLPSKYFKEPTQKDDEDRTYTAGVSQKEHTLADMEFYNNLTDSINRFNQFKIYIPTSLHRDYMLAWVRHITIQRFFDLMEEKLVPILKSNIKAKSLKGREQIVAEWDSITGASGVATDILNKVNLFNILKEYNPTKYRKAVAEFSKAVGL